MGAKFFYRDIDLVYFVTNKLIRNNLINQKDRVLLSFSGGQDSICFVFILNQLYCQLELNITFFWCHHLWQTDSFYLMQQIAKLSFLLRLNNCFAIPLNFVPSELLARKWRQSCSYRVSLFYNYSKICLAHTFNDKIENIFLNFMRGTGLIGLAPLRWIQFISKPNIANEKSQIFNRFDKFDKFPLQENPLQENPLLTNYSPVNSAALQIEDLYEYENQQKYLSLTQNKLNLCLPMAQPLGFSYPYTSTSIEVRGKQGVRKSSASLYLTFYVYSFGLLPVQAYCTNPLTVTNGSFSYKSSICKAALISVVRFVQKLRTGKPFLYVLAQRGRGMQRKVRTRIFSLKDIPKGYRRDIKVITGITNKYRAKAFTFQPAYDCLQFTHSHINNVLWVQSRAPKERVSFAKQSNYPLPLQGNIYIRNKSVKSKLSAPKDFLKRQNEALHIPKEYIFKSKGFFTSETDKLFCVAKKPFRKAWNKSYKPLIDSSYIVRPLLSISRIELNKICYFWELPIYPDKSNQKVKFLRNRVRRQLLPTIKLFFNLNIENIFLQLAKIVETEDYCFTQIVNEFTKNTDVYHIKLDKF